MPRPHLRFPQACLLVAGSMVLGSAQSQTTGDPRVDRGWITYHIACSSCHGQDAEPVGLAPDLRPILRTMTQADFEKTVLTRYRVAIGLTESLFSDRARQSVLAETDARARSHGGTAVMPAWQATPEIRARVLDLYGYLRGRADGTLPPGRPEARAQ
ncbi:MAG: hypothetical protein WCJ69_09995 [Betaproteobacteria bacterium]